jgi:ribosomal protein S13
MKSDLELLTALQQQIAESLNLIRHWRRLHALQEAEIARMQGEIDALIVERIEREWVVGNLKRELAEQVELNATFWDEVKAELPQGMKRDGSC